MGKKLCNGGSVLAGVAGGATGNGGGGVPSLLMWGTAYSCDTTSGTSANKIVYKVGAVRINSGGVTKPSLCLARAETFVNPVSNPSHSRREPPCHLRYSRPIFTTLRLIRLDYIRSV